MAALYNHSVYNHSVFASPIIGGLLAAVLLWLAGAFIASAPAYADTEQIERLQQQLVTHAKKLRHGEERLSELAIRQTRLDARITDARTQIDENREEIDTLLRSLLRLSQTPPEAVVVMPGELRQTLQAAQLMSRLTTQIQTKTAMLDRLVVQLKQDELELAETREKLQQQRSRLLASQKALEEKLQLTQAAYEQENKKSFTQQVRDASRIRDKSRNVDQLVTTLEEKRQSSEKAKDKITIASIPSPRRNPLKQKRFTQQKGKLKLPVAGRITRRYGQKEGVDQTSHGYYLASAAGATVTSPATAEVLFTGPFLNYDNIVILRFDNGYHLLLAGMGRIQCSVGQKLQAGQPIGRLKTGGAAITSLYLELRKNGKPIDPSPWFG